MKSLTLHSDELRPLLSTGRCEVRRRVKPQPELVVAGYDNDPSAWDMPFSVKGDWPSHDLMDGDNWPLSLWAKYYSPLGSPGEVRWVRETWADVNTEEGPLICYKADGAVRTWHEFSASFGPDYGAGPSMDYESYPGNYTMWWTDLLRGEPGHSWRSSSTMPRWASRLTVRTLSVSVERVEGEWWWVGDVEVSK